MSGRVSFQGSPKSRLSICLRGSLAFGLAFLILPMSSQNNAAKILFIDTAGLNPYCYNTFFSIAKENGMKLEFKAFYDLSPTSESYSGVILSLDGLFLQNLALDLQAHKTIKQPLIRTTLEFITKLSKQSNSIIGILLPATNNSMGVYALLNYFLHQWHAFDDSTKLLLEPIIQTFTLNLLQSDAKKSSLYHTALLTKSEHLDDLIKKHQKGNEYTIYDPQSHLLVAQTLPLQNNSLHTILSLQALLPFALYFKNPSTNNHFFIAKNSLVTFCDIQENFFINPIEVQLRDALLVGLKETIHFISQQISTSQVSDISQETTHKKSPDAAAFKPSMEFNLCTTYNWTKQGIWCAWTGIDAYKDKELEAAEHILKSGLNLLWIELNPEWYLSDNAIKKDRKEAFLNAIQLFTHALTIKSQELNLPIPHIFVGTDITSNFAQAPVQNPVSDIYGATYTKIPSPFDYTTFWNPEVFAVLSNFVQEWKTIGNGLPLSGVFFDLEMYHAQKQSGQYLPLMDFSDTAWKLYCTHHNLSHLLNLDSVYKRIVYLQQSHSFQHYFDTLEKAAQSVGKNIKEHIHRILPEGIIGVYNITLPSSWFYCGLLAGLSAAQEPVIFASFNNEYKKHKPWLCNKEIYLLHLPVLLLSKIKNIANFDLIKKISKNHSGIWLNRIERLEQSRDSKDWPYDFGLEVTPLNTDIFIEKLKETIKNNQNTH